MKRPYLIKQDGTYEIKVRTCAGLLDINQLAALREIASDYGSGEIHLTIRQEVLLLDIKENYLEEALKRLEEVDLRGGSAGPRVRNIVCCVGLRCKNCVQDVVSLAKKLDREYGEMELPGAVKVAIGGCPFPCVRPNFNDIGIVSRVYPVIDEERCDGCGKCVETCLMKAIAVNENGKAVINRDKCKMCGRCIINCPISAVSAEEKGFTILVGGRGTWPAFKGDILAEMVRMEEVVPLVGRILDYYKVNALPKEKRLRPFVKRVGIERMREEILGTEKRSRETQAVGIK